MKMAVEDDDEIMTAKAIETTYDEPSHAEEQKTVMRRKESSGKLKAKYT
jgi:hypothetical protein